MLKAMKPIDKRKQLWLDLHDKLLHFVGKTVHCRAVEDGKVLFGAHGRMSMSIDHRGLKRYIVSDHNGNTVRFRVLDVLQIVEHGNNVFITVEKKGYSKHI